MDPLPIRLIGRGGAIYGCALVDLWESSERLVQDRFPEADTTDSIGLAGSRRRAVGYHLLHSSCPPGAGLWYLICIAICAVVDGADDLVTIATLGGKKKAEFQ